MAGRDPRGLQSEEETDEPDYEFDPVAELAIELQVNSLVSEVSRVRPGLRVPDTQAPGVAL